MKKTIVILIGILLLTGCGSNSASTLDVDATRKSLDNEMKDMIELKDEELETVYELDLSLMKEYTIKSNSKRNGYIYAIIKVDSKNKEKVKNQMENLFDILKNQSSLYSPEAVEILDNKVQTSVGDYLIYLSYKDTDKAYELVKENIK